MGRSSYNADDNGCYNLSLRQFRQLLQSSGFWKSSEGNAFGGLSSLIQLPFVKGGSIHSSSSSSFIRFCCFSIVSDLTINMVVFRYVSRHHFFTNFQPLFGISCSRSNFYYLFILFRRLVGQVPGVGLKKIGFCCQIRSALIAAKGGL